MEAIKFTENTEKTEKTIPAQAARAVDTGSGGKRSRLVTVTAVSAIVIGGFLSVSFARANFTLISMFSSPSFQLSMAHATVPVEMPPAAAFLVRYPRGFFFFSLIMWLSVTALGFGVLRRRQWGRDGFNVLLYLGAAVLFILFMFPELVVPKPFFYQGISLAPEFNAAVKTVKLWLQGFCGAGTALFFWLARKFETQAVRNEFKS
ncbi:MAG: hypothetical protein NTX59_09695 [Elusimicrobia bacterium]|nr:hypothetical protein [Elusimicrobiota bacterium]